MKPDQTPVANDAHIGEKPLTVRILHSFAEAEPFRTAWDDLAARSGADVYQTFDWCSIWWKYYGEKRSLHLLLCYSGEELVGVVPGFIETLWLGPIRIRAAKLVGSDFTLHLCNLPVLASALPTVVSRAIQHFIGQHRCDLLAIGPLSGPRAQIEEVVAVAQTVGRIIAKTATQGTDCNTYFELPTSFDDYLKSLSKQPRDNITRYLRQLTKTHQASFDTVSEPDKVVAEFELFRKLHEAQWKVDGKLGHFGDWPKSEDFNRELVRVLGDRKMVQFDRILADDQVVSSDFSFVFNNKLYSRLPARARGPEWDKYGFGRMGLVKLFKHAINEGRHCVEAGRGHYEYKLLLGGREFPMRTVQFMRRGFGVSTRVRLFRATANLLVKTYYKVFVRRLAPRIPALQGPIWPYMIRITW